jgi:DNA-binding ferritin-like protein (Dps family)
MTEDKNNYPIPAEIAKNYVDKTTEILQQNAKIGNKIDNTIELLESMKSDNAPHNKISGAVIQTFINHLIRVKSDITNSKQPL